MQDAWATFETFFSESWNAVKATASSVVVFMQTQWDTLTQSFETAINALPSLWLNAKEKIFSVWEDIERRWNELTHGFKTLMGLLGLSGEHKINFFPSQPMPNATGLPAPVPGEMPKIPQLGGKPIVFNPNIENLIQTHAQAQGVDPALVRAMMKQESGGNPNAVSPAGAGGLMQLMPATARRFGVQNRFDPAQNIAGGVKYLAWLLERFKGDKTKAVAAYNAGEGAVDKYGGVPPYRETRDYVSKVMGNYQRQKVEGGIDIHFNNPPPGTKIEPRQSKGGVKINPKFGYRSIGA